MLIVWTQIRLIYTEDATDVKPKIAAESETFSAGCSSVNPYLVKPGLILFCKHCRSISCKAFDQDLQCFSLGKLINALFCLI